MGHNGSKPVQEVKWEVAVEGSVCFMRFTTAGVPPITIPMDPQAAFEMGEMLARAAHMARFGEPPKTDKSYLHDEIKKRVTEDLRKFVTKRVEIMLNGLREDRKWTNAKLAAEVVDRVMQKVT